MKVFAINGSARTNSNTATVLKSALEAAKDFGKEHNIEVTTEIINLYQYKYTGCKSCFSCKLLGGKSYGNCILNDDLHEVLVKLKDADVVFFGSPIYFFNVSGEMRSFLERLLFPYHVYDKERSSLAPKKFKTAIFYTLGMSYEHMKTMEVDKSLSHIEMFIGNIFTKPEVLYVNDTYQFSDYSKYKCDAMDPVHKAEVRDKQFPIDCKKAYDIGKSLCESAFNTFHNN